MLAIRDRSVVRFSVTPSAKYCWSGSLLRLVKGSTTIDRRGAWWGSSEPEPARMPDCGDAGEETQGGNYRGEDGAPAPMAIPRFSRSMHIRISGFFNFDEQPVAAVA